jgi:hypothetical protein
MTRLAAMLGAKEYNYAKGGAQLMWVNDVVNNEFGTLGTILHTWKRPNRAAGVLTSNVSVGATTIPVTPNPSTGSTTGPAFKVDDIIHIGTGSTLVRVERSAASTRSRRPTSTCSAARPPRPTRCCATTLPVSRSTSCRRTTGREHAVPALGESGSPVRLRRLGERAALASGRAADGSLAHARGRGLRTRPHALTYSGSWNPGRSTARAFPARQRRRARRNPTARQRIGHLQRAEQLPRWSDFVQRRIDGRATRVAVSGPSLSTACCRDDDAGSDPDQPAHQDRLLLPSASRILRRVVIRSSRR